MAGARRPSADVICVYLFERIKALAQTLKTTTLGALSADLSAIIATASQSLVRVDDGTRLTATGVIWTADGTIVTTSHGTERDEDLVVELADGRRLAAVVAGRDPESDLAVLTIAATGLPAIARAGEDDAQVGHLALAIGRPGRAGVQATLGIVSARMEAQSDGRPEYFLHTDATLYPGFSGGALVDAEGRMAGLLNLSLGRGQGVALGVPIVEHVVEQILRDGHVRRGYLGISTQPVALPQSVKAATGVDQEHGLLVVDVALGSPADQAGILLGDVLLTVEGEGVGHPERLRRQLRRRSAGQTVAIVLARAGARHELTATLGANE
jgi:S1-C subfamily serine protease